MYYKTTESLLAFIKKSPTAFQATAEMEKKFTENGYQLLSEQEYWKLQPGGKYIVTRNHSALIAFSIPKKESFGIDCIFDSKEGMSEVSHYRKSQRFSGF